MGRCGGGESEDRSAVLCDDYVAVLESVERVTTIPGFRWGQRRSGTGKDPDRWRTRLPTMQTHCLSSATKKDVGRISSEIGELGVSSR